MFLSSFVNPCLTNTQIYSVRYLGNIKVGTCSAHVILQVYNNNMIITFNTSKIKRLQNRCQAFGQFWAAQKQPVKPGQRVLTVYIWRSRLDMDVIPLPVYSPHNKEQIQNIKHIKQLTHKDLQALTYDCQTRFSNFSRFLKTLVS